MFVLLVIDDVNEEDELREIVGPFASRAAAAKYREAPMFPRPVSPPSLS